ncbi:MAG: sigma-70 family RNA polymerase sigma factor [Chloroflexi bacterium]|jgi:RNA polymerase sigma-70 factor (ECF subfamily)|nr:sigma-70 family RNA polymerase sigma factor [Chloroflexota bacterium]
MHDYNLEMAVDYSQLEDDVLLRLITKAQANALNELYGRYGRLVYSIALHILGEKATAEETTLDVFTKVWQKADTFRSNRGSVRVWLTSMTRNRAIDVLRQQSVRLNVQNKLWTEATSQPISNERIPETAVDLNLRKQRIRTAIIQLPEEQRIVLDLAYFQGYSQSEISQLCNVPLGTVKTRVRLAIQKLRRLLQDDQIE